MNAYLHGPSPTPLLGETIGDNLRRTVERFGDREALVVRSQNYRATYRQLWESTTVLARALLASGVRQGDRVGIWSPNRFEWVLTQFATARIGAILVNINPAYKTSELQYALVQSGTSLLIHARAFRTSDYVQMVEEVRPDCPALREAVTIDTGWMSLLERAHASSDRELEERESVLQFDDPINIQYTSGTTGFPKGATLSHHNILNNGFFVGEMIKYTEQDRVCIPVPFYHCFGDGDGQPRLHVSWRLHGRPGRGVRPARDPGSGRRRAVHFPVRRPDDVHRGARAPTFRRVRSDVAAHRHHGGVALPRRSDEAGAVADAHAGGHDLLRHDRDFTRVDAEQLRTIRSIAACRRSAASIPTSKSRSSTPESGAIVPRGVPGELCTRGYSVMVGYWGNDEATRDAIDTAGWMHTGDLATADDEGYVNIVGRIKDMIIRGGENVYPREVEEFLYTHASVLDVQVIGVPSEKYGEEVMAWVKVRPGHTVTDEDLVAFCRGRIATFKIPRFWKFVDEFPTTVTGKVQKFRLREAAIAELGLQRASAQETA